MLTNNEREVDVNAFLVSKTDAKGKITYCNEPFLEIVGAKQKELLGKPHNIVRHPDMPRVVFKILWEHIQEKREVFAYVKNKSFDGGFYWVFANITASLDAGNKIVGYYSVRRKPNERAIKIIEPLYKELLEVEKRSGIKASFKALNEILNEKKVTYNEFINNLQRL